MDRRELFYDLPGDLIAQRPLTDRGQARLLIIDRETQTWRHSRFECLGDFLPPGSFLIVNDSKVIPARLLGHKERSGGKVEIFLLKKLPDGFCYEVLLRPLGKIKNGDIICFDKSPLKATVIDRDKRTVRFNFRNIAPQLQKIGHTPLPPYIKRADEKQDREDYQTVYARQAGSVAAPTAGMHFTRKQMEALKKSGHMILRTTLHVNYATFREIEEQNTLDHKMHFESYEVKPSTWRNIQGFRQDGKKAVVVGTTSCRVLETVAQNSGLKGETDLFIYPGFDFRMTDVLITNFHLPYSSLLLLVYAFGGTDLIKRAYQEAIREKYRFFSYGDAMLIL